MAEYTMDSEAIARFDGLRSDAVRHALAVCEAAAARISDRFGARERETCAEDIAFHLDFVRPVLETGNIAPFISYLGWLTQVLESRGVPTDTLPLSLDALAGFYARVPGDAAAPVVAVLAAGRDALAAGITVPDFDLICPPAWEETVPLCDAALAGDRRAATQLFNAALERGGSLPLSGVHLLQPALYRVGRLWQENKVSVAQEHLASALSQTLMSQGYTRFEPAPPNGQRALFACVAGNRHAIGLRMVADAFEMAGWDVQFLGADTPHASLVSQIRVLKPDLVGLSAALPFHLKSLREAVEALRTALGDECPRIAVGGLALNQFPALAAHIGVETLGTDAVSAVAAAAP